MWNVGGKRKGKTLMIGNHFNTFLCEEEKKGWDNNDKSLVVWWNKI